MSEEDDVFLWPCGTWCYRDQIHEFTHMSDDYEVLAYMTDAWREHHFENV